MLCIPAEFEIDNESIILQMQRVREASWKLEEETTKLRHLIDGTKVKEKGDSEESPIEKERVDELVNEWCRLYREISQALRDNHEESR